MAEVWQMTEIRALDEQPHGTLIVPITSRSLRSPCIIWYQLSPTPASVGTMNVFLDQLQQQIDPLSVEQLSYKRSNHVHDLL